jgi:hypothetical protein
MTGTNKKSETTPPAGNKGRAAPAEPRYDPKVWPAVVEMLAGLGISEAEIAKALGLDLAEFRRCRQQYPELGEAWRTPSKQCIAHVENALFRRATGYDYDYEQMARVGRDTMPVTVRRHVPADTAAIKFLLSKRRPEVWGDNPTEPDDPLSRFFDALMGAVTYPGRQPGEQILGNAEFVKKIEDLTKDDDDPSDAEPTS